MSDPRPGKLGDGRRRPVQFGLAGLMVVVAFAAIVLGMVVLPGIGPLMITLGIWMLVALAIIAAAMGLGRLGFWLFGAFDRLVAWQTREPEWFHPDPVDEPGARR